MKIIEWILILTVKAEFELSIISLDSAFSYVCKSSIQPNGKCLIYNTLSQFLIALVSQNCINFVSPILCLAVVFWKFQLHT